MEFTYLCTQQGIGRHLIAPYNLQQNGVIERKNKAIVGVMRSMLHDQALPFYLWVEACSTAVYL
jgi:transposase InsO family protein